MENVIDPELDKLLKDWESAIRSAPIPFPHKSYIVEYDLARIAIHRYLHNALLMERQRCANLARTVGAKQHEKHLYAECDFSDIAGELIADWILEE